MSDSLLPVFYRCYRALKMTVVPILNVASGVAALLLTKEMATELLHSLKVADMSATSKEFALYFVTIYGQLRIIRLITNAACRAWSPSSSNERQTFPVDAPPLSERPSLISLSDDTDDSPMKPKTVITVADEVTHTENYQEVTEVTSENGAEQEELEFEVVLNPASPDAASPDVARPDVASPDVASR